MIPVARTEKLLIQEVDNELIVYDEERDTAHCLNPMAARVWHYCDGQNTVEDIAKLLEKELDIPADSDVDMRGLVWLTLEELERFHLIKEYLKQPTGVSNISRRKVIKTASLVGGFAIGSLFPVVKSIVAPVPAMAISPIIQPPVKPCKTRGQTCANGLECCSGSCGIVFLVGFCT
jgi:hypothetical protein